MATKDAVYWRDEYNCYHCKCTMTADIWNIQYDTKEDPLSDIHLAKAQLLGDSRIWAFWHFGNSVHSGKKHCSLKQ